MVLREDSRLVQNLRSRGHGGISKGDDRAPAGRHERHVNLSWALLALGRADPEGRTVKPIADHLPEVHDAPASKWRQDRIIKSRGTLQIAGLEGKVVDHCRILAQRRLP